MSSTLLRHPAPHRYGCPVVGVRSFVAAAAAGLSLAAVAAPAGAAPFTAGTGHDPHVATGPGGAGHVVWIADAPAGDQVEYCRVARGGAACERSHALPFPGADAQATHSVPTVHALDDGRVVIAASCWNCGAGGITDRTFVWTSTDGGESFGAPVERGTGLILTESDYIAESDTLVGVGAASLQAMGSTPPAPAPIRYTSPQVIESPAVARVPGSDQVVAVSSDMAQLRFARYAGPLSAPAIGTQASWTIDQPVPGAETASTDASLAAGPRGLLLAYVVGGRPNRVRLHAYDPATGAFDGGAVVAQGPETQDPDLSQASDGELALVWRVTARDGQVRWRRAAADGTFSPVATLHGPEHTSRLEVSAAPGDGGWVVWSGARSSVRVLALPEPPPAAYDGPTRAIRRADRRLRYRLIVPRRCVHAGQRFDATVRWRERRRSGARLIGTVFTLGSERREDALPPFQQTLTVPEFAEPGSQVALRVRTTVRRGGDRSAGRTLRARIAVCA